jgi:hypothetical protein
VARFKQKPRTYQGKEWLPDQKLAPGDLAVSVDLRGEFSPSPERCQRAWAEANAYERHPAEAELITTATERFYGHQSQ